MATFNLKNYLLKIASNSEVGTTEVQLKNLRKNQEPTSTTQKQLDAQREGEAETLTEAQLGKVRKAGTSQVVKTAKENAVSTTEYQLRETKSINGEPTSTTEVQLKDQRKDKEPNSTTEAQLDKVRTGGAETLTEQRLNTSKSKLVKHRNAEASAGDINKLEAQRLDSKNVQEKEVAKPSSEGKSIYDINAKDESMKLANSLNFSIQKKNLEITASGVDQLEELEQAELDKEQARLRAPKPGKHQSRPVLFNEDEGDESEGEGKQVTETTVSEAPVFDDDNIPTVFKELSSLSNLTRQNARSFSTLSTAEQQAIADELKGISLKAQMLFMNKLPVDSRNILKNMGVGQSQVPVATEEEDVIPSDVKLELGDESAPVEETTEEIVGGDDFDVTNKSRKKSQTPQWLEEYQKWQGKFGNPELDKEVKEGAFTKEPVEERVATDGTPFLVNRLGFNLADFFDVINPEHPEMGGHQKGDYNLLTGKFEPGEDYEPGEINKNEILNMALVWIADNDPLAPKETKEIEGEPVSVSTLTSKDLEIVDAQGHPMNLKNFKLGKDKRPVGRAYVRYVVPKTVNPGNPAPVPNVQAGTNFRIIVKS